MHSRPTGGISCTGYQGTAMRKFDLASAVGAGVMLIAILATIAGVYQLSHRSPPPAVQATPAPQRPQPPTVDRQRAEQAQRQLERLREIRQQQEAARARANTRCIGNTLFRVDGDTWTNVGRC